MKRVSRPDGILKGNTLTIIPAGGESIPEILRQLEKVLKDSETALAKLMVFGSVDAYPAAEQAMRRVLGKANWPVTWVQGSACDGRPIAGIQGFAFPTAQVKAIHLEGRVAGTVVQERTLRHCFLGGLAPEAGSASRPDQLRHTQAKLEAALEQAGFTVGDLARTWYYLDDILSWYGAFNEVRTKAYSRVKFRSGGFPASTATSGRNPIGAALMAGAWAVQPLDSTARVAEVLSPMQCPAAQYGSSFSRAVEVLSDDGNRLLISGTASIAPDGGTAWGANLRGQIVRTMEVVESILKSRGFGFADVTRATAYFKDAGGVSEFEAWSAERHLESLPVVAARCEICRDDLLFELEADAAARCAVTPNSNIQTPG